MSKFCGNCGNQLNDNALFCTKCGTKQGAPIQSTQQSINNQPNRVFTPPQPIFTPPQQVFTPPASVGSGSSEITTTSAFVKMLTYILCGIIGIYTIIMIILLGESEGMGVLLVGLHAINLAAFAVLPIVRQKLHAYRQLLSVPFALFGLTIVGLNLLIVVLIDRVEQFAGRFGDISGLEVLSQVKIIYIIVAIIAALYYTYIIFALTIGVKSRGLLKGILITAAILSGLIMLLAFFVSLTLENLTMTFTLFAIGALFVYPAVVVPSAARIK